MKQLQFVSGKAVVDTGYKAFDKACDNIWQGNALADTQCSWYIRPYNEIYCNHHEFKPGELMYSDINRIRTGVKSNIPYSIQEILEDKNRAESYILYAFSVPDKQKYRNVFGWVLTDYHGKLVKYKVDSSKQRNLFKYEMALQHIIPYITNECNSDIPEKVRASFREELDNNWGKNPTISGIVGPDNIERSYQLICFQYVETENGTKLKAIDRPYVRILRGYHVEDVVVIDKNYLLAPAV